MYEILITTLTLFQLVTGQQCGTIGHTNTSAKFDKCSRNAFFINLNDSATCDGLMTSVKYCYGRPDKEANEYIATFAVYRPKGGNNYMAVSSAVTLRVTLEQVHVDFSGNIFSKFACSELVLNTPIPVVTGDVLGVCVTDPPGDESECLELVDRDGDGDLLSIRPAPPDCSETTVPISVDTDDTESHGLYLYANVATAIGLGETDANPAGAVAAIVVFLVLIVVVTIAVIIALFIRKNKQPLSKSFGNRTYAASEESRVARPATQVPQPQVHEYEFQDDYSPGAFSTDYSNANNSLSGETQGGNYCFASDSPLDAPAISYAKLLEKSKEENVYGEERPYEVPAEEEEDIYAQFKAWKVTVIARQEIEVIRHLGSGQFGSVEQGLLKRQGTRPVDVALKSLNNASEEDKVKFLQEAAIMAQFKHPCVIKLHGIVIESDPIILVLGLAIKGDLQKCLVSIQPGPGKNLPAIGPKVLLQFSQQVALGMQYLSAKGFVHRDLAARNILLTSDNLCKVADFGLSRDLADESYYISQGKDKIPIKWTAPEAIYYKRYSTASDVWSYGCLLYEIWSLGHKPFENINNYEAIKKIDSGHRLSPPPGCPKAIYELMIICWHPETSQRPSFHDIVLALLGSEEMVLNIPEEDSSTNPLAGVLGAPLEAGENMYSDLQRRYMHS